MSDRKMIEIVLEMDLKPATLLGLALSIIRQFDRNDEGLS